MLTLYKNTQKNAPRLSYEMMQQDVMDIHFFNDCCHAVLILL